uniref:Sodium/potassium-transporting ATPase subunit beta-2 n=3 Tax=Cacopsylla melanoneura TaxID=428564 RepID=A0A8D9BF60_9HEMI
MSSSKNVANNGPSGYEWEYARKDLGNTKWQNFKLFLYNPETGEVLNRTPKSWGGIFLFYCIFYSILACFFAICMSVLLQTLTDEYPKLQLDESIIGVNPGLGYRPMSPDPEADSLIWYKRHNNESAALWIDQIEDFLEVYKDPTLLPDNAQQMDCDFDNPPHMERVCKVEVERHVGPCTSAFGYGYVAGTPCVFVKLNKIFGWKPDYYQNLDELPDDMPVVLKSYITHATTLNASRWHTVWMSCSGADPHDAEAIGDVDYFPQPGYPGYFYPYTNSPGYLSPLVAVRFRNATRSTLVNVECRAWAKNIRYKKSGLNREGSVHFELLID